MKKTRILGLFLAVLFLLAIVPVSAMAANPTDSRTRYESEFTKAIDALKALDESVTSDPAVAEWIGILEGCRDDGLEALQGFVQAESLQNDGNFGSPKSDVYYQDTARDGDRFGSFRRLWSMYEMKTKGAYNLLNERGRFVVDYYMDPSLLDNKRGHRWVRGAWEVTANDYLIGTLDCAEGGAGGYLFMQFAVYAHEVMDKATPDFNVIRFMIGNGHVYMSRTQMTESSLRKNRVKSPYTDWASFRNSTADLFEFDGSTVRVVTAGEEKTF